MTTNLANYIRVKMASIHDVVVAAAKASRNRRLVKKQQHENARMLLNGKNAIVKHARNKAETGTREILQSLGLCPWRQPNGILIQRMESKSVTKEVLSGIRITLKNDVFTIEQCTPSKQENLFVRQSVLNANVTVNPTHIMRIIQNLLMSFGYAQNVIFTFIKQTNITVNDLARKPRKGMRKSELDCKDRERGSKNLLRHRNMVSTFLGKVTELWQSGGKAKFIYRPPGYGDDPAMLRSTAAASFYQGQCITNDLWVQNLRSTGI